MFKWEVYVYRGSMGSILIKDDEHSSLKVKKDTMHVKMYIHLFLFILVQLRNLSKQFS